MLFCKRLKPSVVILSSNGSIQPWSLMIHNHRIGYLCLLFSTQMRLLCDGTPKVDNGERLPDQTYRESISKWGREIRRGNQRKGIYTIAIQERQFTLVFQLFGATPTLARLYWTDVATRFIWNFACIFNWLNVSGGWVERCKEVSDKSTWPRMWTWLKSQTC